MRTLSLAAALVAGAVLAGCSKPEPAAGAPTPDVVTVDSLIEWLDLDRAGRRSCPGVQTAPGNCPAL